MKIAKILLRTGGVINAMFFLFHIWLGRQIHRWSLLDTQLRSLIEMLNGGGAFFLLLFVVVSLICTKEVLTTRLGHIILVFISALYCLRAMAEIFVSPAFQTIIFATCLTTGLLYVAVFILARRIPHA